jgi:site-specific DNA-cytosine methylase
MAATIRIFDTYSGTGTTTTVAAEVSRITGIRLGVAAISEIDKVLRERLQRRQHYERVFGDISDIVKGKVPPHHMMVASPPCQDFSTIGAARGPEGADHYYYAWRK